MFQSFSNSSHQNSYFRTKVWEIDPNHDNESIHTDNQIFPFAWMVNTHLTSISKVDSKDEKNIHVF
jgi:hypothetical protein